MESRSTRMFELKKGKRIGQKGVYDWQEEQRRQKGGYGLLSLMAIALLDLGLIQRVEDE